MASKKVRKDERCFANPYLEVATCRLSSTRLKDWGETVRTKAEVAPDLQARLQQGIKTNLPLVDHANQRYTQDQSVYTGSAGAALLHLHMATTLHADSKEECSSHLHSALSLLTPSLQHINTHRSTFLCGGAGPLALGAVCHAHLNQWAESRDCIRKLCELYQQHKASFASLPSELLTGHAGYLYALLYLDCHISGAVDQVLISEVASLLLDAGERGREPGLPSLLMYTWHNKHYLGAAHGLAGILTLLLQVGGASMTPIASGGGTESASVRQDVQQSSTTQLPVPSLRPRIESLVRPTVDYLLSLQLPSGNFPSSLESAGSDRLVHWCHGAPGFTHLMAHAYRAFGDQRYLQAAVDCGEVVWRRGLLYKGCGLCHGVSGNAYCFLQLFWLTGRQEYLSRTIKFADWCLTADQRECRTPDRPYSLFEGLAGPTYLYVDILSAVEESWFPALELPIVRKKLLMPSGL